MAANLLAASYLAVYDYFDRKQKQKRYLMIIYTEGNYARILARYKFANTFSISITKRNYASPLYI